jgi:hypothetical protein
LGLVELVSDLAGKDKGGSMDFGRVVAGLELFGPSLVVGKRMVYF